MSDIDLTQIKDSEIKEIFNHLCIGGVELLTTKEKKILDLLRQKQEETNGKK